jgi:hypothetical protein
VKRLEDLHEHVLGHITTIEATYHIARMAIELGVPGDFVECGVYAGAQSAAMARAIIDQPRHPQYGGARRVHLFDSFAGFPPFSEHDIDLRGGGWKAGDSACPLKDVQANMKRWGIPDELLVYHAGWFDETMPIATDRGSSEPHSRVNVIKLIVMLRLDADLYESTRTCMEYLYPLVSPGGWVIVDDWNLDGCRKAIEETLSPNAGEPGHPAPIYFRKSP